MEQRILRPNVLKSLDDEKQTIQWSSSKQFTPLHMNGFAFQLCVLTKRASVLWVIGSWPFHPMNVTSSDKWVGEPMASQLTNNVNGHS